jgi:hypothetical protein
MNEEICLSRQDLRLRRIDLDLQPSRRFLHLRCGWSYTCLATGLAASAKTAQELVKQIAIGS